MAIGLKGLVMIASLAYLHALLLRGRERSFAVAARTPRERAFELVKNEPDPKGDPCRHPR